MGGVVAFAAAAAAAAAAVGAADGAADGARVVGVADGAAVGVVVAFEETTAGNAGVLALRCTATSKMHATLITCIFSLRET
jgi:hypothetical protein